jgi:3-methyl-2-oxobutanoate hydroxymethyltransferase
MLASRGKTQHVNVYVETVDEATAAAAAGVTMITAGAAYMSSAFREAAPRAFINSGYGFGVLATADDYLRDALRILNEGADSYYCVGGLRTIEYLASEGVPVVSHVGLIPSKRTWTGGWKAVGKTAESAISVWKRVRQLEDAGAFAAEIEVVPEPVATAIARRTSLFMISMGSGAGCHAQYLFSQDILGYNSEHVPRHAKQYRNFAVEHERLQRERESAFRELVAEVTTGAYPGAEHQVGIDRTELESFLKLLDS